MTNRQPLAPFRQGRGGVALNCQKRLTLAITYLAVVALSLATIGRTQEEPAVLLDFFSGRLANSQDMILTTCHPDILGVESNSVCMEGSSSQDLNRLKVELFALEASDVDPFDAWERLNNDAIARVYVLPEQGWFHLFAVTIFTDANYDGITVASYVGTFDRETGDEIQ